jgi:hypothetical protein
MHLLAFDEVHLEDLAVHPAGEDHALVGPHRSEAREEDGNLAPRRLCHQHGHARLPVPVRGGRMRRRGGTSEPPPGPGAECEDAGDGQQLFQQHPSARTPRPICTPPPGEARPGGSQSWLQVSSIRPRSRSTSTRETGVWTFGGQQPTSAASLCGRIMKRGLAAACAEAEIRQDRSRAGPVRRRFLPCGRLDGGAPTRHGRRFSARIARRLGSTAASRYRRAAQRRSVRRVGFSPLPHGFSDLS